MPERVYFTDSDEANVLIASDPLALLVGFALDQQAHPTLGDVDSPQALLDYQTAKRAHKARLSQAAKSP